MTTTERRVIIIRVPDTGAELIERLQTIMKEAGGKLDHSNLENVMRLMNETHPDTERIYQLYAEALELSEHLTAMLAPAILCFRLFFANKGIDVRCSHGD